MSDLRGRYPVVLSRTLSWSDMDAFQHVNNAMYFRYFEDARIEYFSQAGLIEHKDKTQLGPILASTSCNFRAPLTFPDTIQIAAVIDEFRRKTFRMKYFVYSEKLAQVAAEGEGLIVYYDYAHEKSCEIPEVILSAIQSIQPAT